MEHRPLVEQRLDALIDDAAASVRQLVVAMIEGAAAGLGLIKRALGRPE